MGAIVVLVLLLVATVGVVGYEEGHKAQAARMAKQCSTKREITLDKVVFACKPIAFKEYGQRNLFEEESPQ